jgi:hypothetical protein
MNTASSKRNYKDARESFKRAHGFNLNDNEVLAGR